ncbi:MAG TPA: hypothetical protein VEB41_14320 [Burkholderiales bacterium]|nr:hypothetical protein [Burkholderiales bacterium]
MEAMPWRAERDSQRSLVEVTYSGHVTIAEVRACAAAVFEELKDAAEGLILIDFTAVTRLDTQTVDVVGLPELFKSLGSESNTREALVAPHGSPAFDAAAFYETVALNRGRKVALFPDRARALAWLAAP